MKWCVSFPDDEEMLIVRPCLVAICMGNRPAAKLLSVLLYRYSVRKEHKEDAENINDLKASRGEKPDQDTTFRIYRKQAQLIKDMCGEIVEKTLHDVAIPTLQLLGYLDIDESPAVHCYDVHLDLVIEALEVRKQGPKQLEKFLISHLQLEKFLIDMKLEKFPINKKSFQLLLEKVLIANRNVSNNKRGRKPRPEAALEGENPEAQITIEIIEDSNRDNSDDDVASANHHDIPASLSSQDMVARQQANGYRTSQDEIPSPSRDSVTNGHTPDDPHTGQLVDRVTTLDIPASLDVVAPETPSPSQASNDRGKNLPRQDSHPTASTSTSKKSKQPPIAKEATDAAEKEPTMQERIVQVFQSFNEFASEALGQPFEYEQSAKNFGIIGKWLKAKATNPPTKEILHDVFFDMLVEAEGDRSNGSFSWIKNMDIPVVIKQYDRRSLGIMFKRKRDAKPKGGKSTMEIAETIGYKVVSEPIEDLPFVGFTGRKKA